MPSTATVRSLPCPTCHAKRGQPCREWRPRAKTGRKYIERHAHHAERVRAAQAILRERGSTVKSARRGSYVTRAQAVLDVAQEIIDGIDIALDGGDDEEPSELEARFRGEMAYTGFDDVLRDWREKLFNAIEGGDA